MSGSRLLRTAAYIANPGQLGTEKLASVVPNRIQQSFVDLGNVAVLEAIVAVTAGGL
jgi:hypothetical protein